MSDIKVIIGFLAAFIVLGGFGCYYYGIKKRNVRPNLVSWLLWLILAAIWGLSYYASGARQTAMISAACVLGDIGIITMSLKRGTIAWNKRDIYYLLASWLVLALWKAFNSPILAQFASLSLHITGAIPTFKKTWLKPHSESRLAWFTFNAGNTLNIFAIKRWAAEIYVYPIYLALHSAIMVMFVFFSPKRKKEGDV